MSDIVLGVYVDFKGGEASAQVAQFNKGLNDTAAAANKAGAAVGGIGTAAGQFQKGVKQATKDSEDFVASIRAWLPHMRTTAAAFGFYYGTRTIANIGKIADAYTNMNARLGLVTRSTSELTRVQSDLFRISQTNQTNLVDTAKLYYRIASAMQEMGGTSAQALQQVDLLGKALKISGAGLSESVAGLQQWGQAMQSGILSGDEFRSVMENMPRVARAMADGLGLTIGELRRLSEAQQLTAEKATTALVSQSEALTREAEKMPLTIARGWQELSNALLKYIGEANEAVGASEKLGASFKFIGDNLDTIMKLLWFPGTVVDGWQILGQSVDYLVSALNRMGFAAEKNMPKLRIGSELQGLRGDSSAVNPAVAPDELQLRIETAINEKVDRSKILQSIWPAIQKYSEDQKLAVIEILKAAEKYKVDAAFALAIAQSESRFRQSAVSPVGAQGVMQLMPDTAKRFGADSSKMEENVDAGVRYLRDLLTMFKGNAILAAAGYNAGEGNVKKYGNQVPPFKETQNYVATVRGNYSKFSGAMHAGEAVPFAGVEETQKFEEQRLMVFENRLKRQVELDKTYSRGRLVEQEQELQKLQAQLNAFNQDAKNRIQIAMDTGDLDAQLKVIEEARQKEADIIRQMNAVSGGKSDEAVRDIDVRIKALQAEQESVRNTTDDAEKLADIQADITKAEVERSIAVQEAGTGSIELQQALQENEQKYGAMREQAMAKEKTFQAEQQKGQLETFKLTQDAAQKTLELNKTRLAAEMAGNEKLRQSALVGKTGVDLGRQYLENDRARKEEQRALIELDRQFSMQKVQMQQEYLTQQEASLRSEMQSTQEKGKQAELQRALVANALEQSKLSAEKQTIEIEAVVKVKEIDSSGIKQKSYGDAQVVEERQLRINQAFEDGVRNAQLFASQAAETYGEIGKSMGTLVVGFANFSQQTYQAFRDLENAKKKIAEDMKAGLIPDEIAGAQAQLAAETLAANKLLSVQFQLYGDMADAAKGFFKENTKGFVAMSNAAKVFRAFQMAMQLKQVAAQLLGDQQLMASDAARTTSEIANSAARGQVKSNEALSNQASGGDSYTAFARVALMAALMAAIGFSVAGAVGTSGYNAEEERKKRQETAGTGTVLGDSSAKSASIANSLEIIKDNSSADLNYSAKMLSALQGIQDALAGASAAVFTNVEPAIKNAVGKLNLTSAKHDPLGFDKTSRSLTDAGIYTEGQRLGKILAEGFSGAMYAEVTTTRKAFGMTLSKSSETFGQALDKSTTRQFNRVFSSIRDALVAGGEAFGLSAEDFTDRLSNFVVDFGKISLYDMTGEEAQAQIEAIFSSLTDSMAKKLMPGLQTFQKLGEGYAETFFRVGEGVQRATGQLESLGMVAIQYGSIANKQGDVAAEIVKQTLVAQGNLTDGLQDYIMELNGASDEVLDIYRKLKEASGLMRAADVFGGDTNLDRTMINAAGGVDAFLSSMQTFTKEFMAASVGVTGQIDILAEQFGRLGYVMPESGQAFADMVRGIDTSTKAGKLLFGAMIQLSESFAEVQKTIDDIKGKYTDIFNVSDFSKSIETVKSDFATLIADVEGRIKSAQSWGNAFTSRKASLEIQRTQTAKNITSDTKGITRKLELIDFLEEELAKQEGKRASVARDRRIARLKDQLAKAHVALGELQTAFDEDTTALATLDKSIADLIARGPGVDQGELDRLIQERADLFTKQGEALLDSLSKAWETLGAAIDKAKSLQADLQDKIASLTSEIGGKRGLADYKAGKADAAMLAVRNAEAGNWQLQIDLIEKAKAAVLERYDAETAALTEAKDKLTAQQGELEKLQSGFDNTISTMSRAMDNLAQFGRQLSEDYVTLGAPGFSNTEWANTKLNSAKQGVQDYLASIATGTPRDVEREVTLENDLRQAIMDRYNAEMAEIQRITDEKVKALETERDERQKAHDKQIEALQKEMAAATDLFNAVKSVADYAKKLKLGANSTLSPEAKLAEAQRQYNELLMKAQGGDADAIAKMTGASDAYLEAARAYFGSNGQYTSIFAGVQSAMEGLGAMKVSDPNSIQAKIDQLNTEHEAYLKSIDTQIADLNDPEKNLAIKELREKTLAELAPLRGYADATRALAAESLSKAEIQSKANLAKLDEVKAQIADIDNNPALIALKEDTIRQLQELEDALSPALVGLQEDASTKMQEMVTSLYDANILNEDQLAILRDMAKQMGVNVPDRAPLSPPPDQSLPPPPGAIPNPNTPPTLTEEEKQKYKEKREKLTKQIAADEAELARLTSLTRTAARQDKIVALEKKLALEKERLAAIPQFMRGGLAMPGLALVGENGPELARFNQPTRIMSAQDTQEALSGGPRMFAALEALKTEMRASVKVQSQAYPAMLETLVAIDNRLEAVEREQRVRKT